MPEHGDGGQAMVERVYYTYVLRSINDGKLYIGYTDDLQRRLRLHKEGKVIATKGRLPISLIYYEACLSEEKAIKREKYFKTGFGKNFLKTRI